MKRIKTRWYGTVIFSLLFMCSLFLGFGTGNEVKAAVTLKNPLVSGNVSTWDCIWFGSYPQTEILPGSAEYNSLRAAGGWDANNEITLNGVKYRRMQKAHATSSEYSGREGYYHWSDATTWHYFRYEPIKWRVLEKGDALLLLADKALDTKQHISEKNWSQSSIRTFLNSEWTGKDSFLGTAFTAEQQSVILVTEHKDKLAVKDFNVDTSDRIYVPDNGSGKSDISNINYGFPSGSSYNTIRRVSPTDYAHAMGTCTFSTGTCRWALRRYVYWTDGSYQGIYGVSENGGTNFYVSDLLFGIRPMMRINASRTDLYSYAGTVSSNGTVSEVEPQNNGTWSGTGGTSSNYNSTNPAGNGSSVNANAPKKAKIKKVQLSGRRGLKVVIKRDKKASGYQLQYSTNKKFKKKKTKSVMLNKNKKTTKILKNLKSGKKYYIRVRSFKKVRVNGTVSKVVGSWSKVKVSKKVR